jgi:hypothetical protein
MPARMRGRVGICSFGILYVSVLSKTFLLLQSVIYLLAPWHKGVILFSFSKPFPKARHKIVHVSTHLDDSGFRGFVGGTLV